ncbi:DUF397 domain-containing protein [Streptomyces sp. BH105]|uniref:DUF397 domain-containing protein n=1 Tax=Streptomyces sp. BH105 TaxID=3410408 RepID=UPI003CECE8E8
MTRYDLPADRWKKSSYSEGANGQCLETQTTKDGLAAVGDSKDRRKGAITMQPAAWQMFVQSVAKR